MKISVQLGMPSELEQMLAMSVADAASLFPNQIRAIQGLAQLAQRRWIEYGSGARALPSGRKLNRMTGGYASSIKIAEDGVLQYVIYSDDPKAEWIERGFPAWDMTKLLSTSHKVRRRNDGKRYLVVPFRHKTPGGLGVTMPEQLHSFMLSPERKASVVTGTYSVKSLQDGLTDVTRRAYKWGDRLTRADVTAIGLDPDAEGRNMVGMVKMASNTGHEYVTFRVMSEDHQGSKWQMPEREGYEPARATFDFIQAHYEGLMRVAIEEDVKHITQLATGGK